MIQPLEMKETHPIKLHAGGVSTTTEVWNTLSASFEGDVSRVAALVESNPQLLTCQYDYTSPLHLAVREGHVDLVRFLIERGALDPTYRTHPFLDSLLTVAVDRGFTLLHDMGHTGDLAKARLLIEHGADVNRVDDEYRSTALGYAARWGHVELVKLLLDCGADADQSGAPWATPLAWARKKNQAEVEQVLEARELPH